MRRAIGPIVTTGVAMVAAGVVVANPILAPRSDIRIPAVALSAGDDMLDKSFLDAIAPAAPESNSPLSVLKQLVSALAADATYIGKNAIVDAFVAGVAAVSGPVPATTPVVSPQPVAPAPVNPSVVSPAPDYSTLVPDQEPYVDPSTLAATMASVPSTLTNQTSAFINGSVVPAVENVVSAIYSDATYLTKNVLTAAFVVGVAVAAEPGLIGDTIKALVNGDFQAAFRNAINAVVKVVEIPITSSMLIINAIKDVIENHLQEINDAFNPGSSDPQTPAVDGGGDTPSVTPPIGRRPSGSPVLMSRTRSNSAAAAVTRPAAALGPRGSAALPAARQVVGAVRDAVVSVGEQVGAAIHNPAAPAGVTARSRGAAAAR